MNQFQINDKLTNNPQSNVNNNQNKTKISKKNINYNKI